MCDIIIAVFLWHGFDGRLSVKARLTCFPSILKSPLCFYVSFLSWHMS